MIRVVTPEPLGAAGTNVELSPDDVHHLRVRRVAAGEDVIVLDGVGHVADGKLERDGSRAWVSVTRVASVKKPPELRLLVGAGDRDRFAGLIEKCVELGVTDLTPVVTERSDSVSTRLRDSHYPGLQRRAVEALKQCGGAWALTVHPIVTLEEGLSQVVASGIRWLADPAGIDPAVPEPNRPVAILVGPEGGFTLAERKQALGSDFKPVRLAARTLRFDTAALVAAAFAGQRRKEIHG